MAVLKYSSFTVMEKEEPALFTVTVTYPFAVDPDSLNPDPDTDPDPAFQVNPEPDLIRIKGF